MSLCGHLSSDDTTEALRKAAEDGHLGCVMALTEAGADVNDATHRENYYKPALHYAAENGQEQIVKYLIEKGANVNTTDIGYERTALICAVSNGHEQIVRDLVELGADLTTKECKHSVLHYAVIYGQEKVLKYLIDIGVDVNQLDRDGYTALKLAACYGKDKCVDLLLKGGADVNNGGENQHDYPLLDAAGLDAMYNPGGYGSEKCVKVLLNAGADVNVTNSEDDTTLMAAAFNGYCSSLDALLESGVDVNANDCNGFTALTMIGVSAFDYKTKELFACMQKCLRAGAHVNKKNNDGDGALKLFGDSELPKIFCKLLEAAGETKENTCYDDPVKCVGTLKHLCREIIRKRLLQMSPVNLFCRVPLLGLPSIVTQYILYDMSLDQEDEDENTTDSGNENNDHQA